MSLDVNTYTYPIRNSKISDVAQLVHHCKIMYHDTWFENESILERVASDHISIDLCFDSGDTLVLQTGDRVQNVLWFSYETQNVYFGDPMVGAVWLGNLMAETGLSYSKTEVFAEYLAYKGDINKFKGTPNTNLLAALLNKSAETESSVKKGMDRILHRAYSINTVLNSMMFAKDKSQFRDLDVTFNRMIYPVVDYSFNDVTLASRNPGMAEYDEKTNSLVFSESARDDYLTNFGIKLPTHSLIAPYGLLYNRKKVDYFIKNAYVLNKWCKDCR